MVTRTEFGPNGIRLELDHTQIFPDDPGNGTPALVIKGEYTATFHCALNEGELDCGGYQLDDREMRWLEEQEILVDAFLTGN
jgi:hypothetical protein